MNFEGLLGGFAGNARAKELLAPIAHGDRPAHAVLLEGPVGSGRRTMARLLARAVLCTCPEPSRRPCGVCSSCRKAENGNHPDITELGGDGGARSFHIEEIRKLQEQAFVLPNDGDKRIFILVNAHHMTVQAQNALLKLLEEPPPHLMIVLTADSRSSLLPTVISRTLCIPLNGVEPSEGLPVLQARFPEQSEKELTFLLTMFGGCIGQAIAAMEDGHTKHLRELLAASAEALIAPSELPLLKLIASAEKDKSLLTGLFGGWTLLFRDAMALRSGGQAVMSGFPDQSQLLSRRLTGQRLLKLIDEVELLHQSQLRNMNASLLVTLTCARLRAAAGFEDKISR